MDLSDYRDCRAYHGLSVSGEAYADGGKDFPGGGYALPGRKPGKEKDEKRVCPDESYETDQSQSVPE